MSCQNCEDMQERNDVAYIRVGKANVGLTGCDEHLNQILRKLYPDREYDIIPVRVLGTPKV